MPRITRTADITWVGTVARGEGKISGGSGALELLPFTLASRISNPEGKTSPEELLAAAVGSCFTTSLGTELVKAGFLPELLSINATCVLDQIESGDHRVVALELDVSARAEGLDEAALIAAAETAEADCPMAQLVAASAEVRLTTRLEGGANGD